MDDGARKVIDKFSPDEIELFRDVFKEFDRDGDETIDTSELGSVMTELGQTCTPEMIKDMISVVDADQTGSIDFEEFLELMAMKTINEMQEEMQGDDENNVDDADEIPPEPQGLGSEQLSEIIEVITVIKTALGGSCEAPSESFLINKGNTELLKGSSQATRERVPAKSVGQKGLRPVTLSFKLLSGSRKELKKPLSRANMASHQVTARSDASSSLVADLLQKRPELKKSYDRERSRLERRGQADTADVDEESSTDEAPLPGNAALGPDGLIGVLKSVRTGMVHAKFVHYVLSTGAPSASAVDALDHASLMDILNGFLKELRELLFEEEGYELVHCEEDAEAGRGLGWQGLRGDAEGAFGEEREVKNFFFAEPPSAEDAIGPEAYLCEAARQPHGSVPKRAVLPLLEDESLENQHGFLSLNGHGLRDRAAVCFATFLTRDAAREGHRDLCRQRAPLVRHLELQKNYLTPGGAMAVLQACQSKGCMIHHLDLSRNQLGVKTAHLPRGPSVVRALLGASDRSQGKARDDGSASKGQSITNFSQVETTAACACRGGGICESCAVWRSVKGVGEEVRNLLKGRSALGTLKVLRLAHNFLTDNDAVCIAEALSENASLHELDLSHNQLGYRSAVALSDMLSCNTDLKVLNVSWNAFTSPGANHFLEKGLGMTGTLEEVDLSWVGLQDSRQGCSVDKGGKLLGKVLGASYLKKVKACHNGIGYEGAVSIANNLKNNSSLTALNLSHNPLTSAGVQSILRAVRESNTIEELDLTSTLAGPSVKDGRCGETILQELKESNRKRGFASIKDRHVRSPQSKPRRNSTKGGSDAADEADETPPEPWLSGEIGSGQQDAGKAKKGGKKKGSDKKKKK
eukprot:gene5494-8359_t